MGVISSLFTLLPPCKLELESEGLWVKGKNLEKKMFGGGWDVEMAQGLVWRGTYLGKFMLAPSLFSF